LASDDHGNIVHTGMSERPDLTLDQRQSARFDQTLRRVASRAVEPRAFARGEDDSTHLCTPVLREAGLAPSIRFG
jgi:hypothetical protein